MGLSLSGSELMRGEGGGGNEIIAIRSDPYAGVAWSVCWCMLGAALTEVVLPYCVCASHTVVGGGGQQLD